MNVTDYKILENGAEEMTIEKDYLFFKTTSTYQRKNGNIFKRKNNNYYVTGFVEYIDIKQLFDFMKT